MYKMKLSLVLVSFLMTTLVSAQTLQDGRKFLYQQRFQSAKETLEKVVAAAPANPEAIYWLAQAHFESKDVNAAKDVLRKGMEGANGSNPLLLVAMGQAELVEKKANDARQRFETALSLSKGKDPAVFVAIGKANLEEGGDPAYGIEKLKLGVAVKNFKDPMAHVYMGDLFRKLMDGGGAVSSYDNALVMDPKLAIAKYKKGKIYLTQGNDQRDLFLNLFNEAILDDPSYTPALYDLYVYYYFRNVNEATKFFNLYKANTDPGPALDYEEASLQFASADFKNAIVKADALLQSQGDAADARLYRLKAYSFDKIGDSVNALSLLETFFQKAKPDQINSDNYVVAAFNAAKQKAAPEKIEYYFNKSIEADTVLANKIDYAKKAADYFKKNSLLSISADWYLKILTIKPKPSNVDYYNAGLSFYNTQNFARSDSLFTIYKSNYPNDNVGYLWSFRSRKNIDTTGSIGMAIQDALDLIKVTEIDKVKYKSQIVEASGYLANYFANVKSDYESSIKWFDKILEVDPTNADAIKYKDILSKRLSSKK